MHRKLWAFGVAALVGAWVPGTAQAGVLLVCNGTGQPCPAGFDASNASHFESVGAAATAAADGDTILIWPGEYKEGVSVRNKSGLTFRGMDRYGVVFNGDVDGDDPQFGEAGFGQFPGNPGIAISIGSKGDPPVRDVTIENMSGTHYGRQPFYWENVNGYRGRYLHAYINGTYGIYSLSATGDPLDPSVLEHSYAYGHDDGGFYIGECAPCNVVLRKSWSEWNALGYSGTNAGGNLVIEDSIWNDNIMGIVPNTLNSEEHLPQRGAIIRNNLVFGNNNEGNARGGGADVAVWGVGIGITGGSANQVFGNTVFDNGRFGIVTLWLFTPPHYNMIFNNTVYDNGTQSTLPGADLADAGPGSFHNCWSDNVTDDGGEPTTDPPELQTLNSCRSEVASPVTAPVAQSPAAAANAAVEAGESAVLFNVLGEDGAYPDPSNRATPLDGDLTPRQLQALACHPNPCADIGENNAFCQAGEPVGALPVSPECASF